MHHCAFKEKRWQLKEWKGQVILESLQTFSSVWWYLCVVQRWATQWPSRRHQRRQDKHVSARLQINPAKRWGWDAASRCPAFPALVPEQHAPPHRHLGWLGGFTACSSAPCHLPFEILAGRALLANFWFGEVSDVSYESISAWPVCSSFLELYYFT